MPKLNDQIMVNSRLIAVLFLGLSAGLPTSLTSSTLQAWFTQANINIVAIGTLSLLGLPYILKFLWSPLMDYYGFHKLGKRKGWILLTQCCLACSIFFLAQFEPQNEAMIMGLLALCVAFFSASQDISIDAYRTDVLAASERGLGVSYYIFTFRLGLLVSGGLALILADQIGWRITYEFMALLIFLSMIPAYFAPQPVEVISSSKSLWQTTLQSLQDLMRREKMIVLMLFIIFYKFGDALALSLMTNFLLHGLHFSLTEIGVAYKMMSFIATILGAFVAGIFLIHWNIYRALLVFGLAQAFSNLMFVFLALSGKCFLLMASSIFIENFCSGLSTAAFLAFLMLLCDHRFTASQFAVLSAIASLGRVFVGPFAATLVNNVGWVQFYIIAFILSFPGIIFLFFLRDKVMYYAPATAD